MAFLYSTSAVFAGNSDNSDTFVMYVVVRVLIISPLICVLFFFSADSVRYINDLFDF